MVLFLAPWELWSLLNLCPFYPILQVWGSAQWLFYGNDSVSVASGVQPALPQFSKICLCHSVGMSVLSFQENGSYWWKTKKHRPDRPLSLYFFYFLLSFLDISWGATSQSLFLIWWPVFCFEATPCGEQETLLGSGQTVDSHIQTSTWSCPLSPTWSCICCSFFLEGSMGGWG